MTIGIGETSVEAFEHHSQESHLVEKWVGIQTSLIWNQILYYLLDVWHISKW